jgi:hypothetical protein
MRHFAWAPGQQGDCPGAVDPCIPFAEPVKENHMKTFSNLLKENLMKTWLRQLFTSKSPGKQKPAPRRTRLELEGLEERQLMSVTYWGGAVLPNVKVQGLYVGDQWSSNATLSGQFNYLDGFLNNIVNSRYMDALTNAGYGVGRGSAAGGIISYANLPDGSTLEDSTLQSWLGYYVDHGNVQAADANTLYVCFVEPNVIVHTSFGNSVNNFRGYHTAFTSPNGSTVRYAVLAYPRGTVNNAGVSFLSDIDSITKSASHEIAEAVTDPDIDYGTKGWYDNVVGGEIGDIKNDQVVRLNGYAVQRVIDKNDLNMTPTGAAADRQVTFVLQSDGSLLENSSAGLSYLRGGIASLSDQSIDLQGHAMVDVVTTDGSALEYHDTGVWTYMASNIASAKAGQGVSYLLDNNGYVYKYDDLSGGTLFLDSGAVQIDAGTDQYGVTTVGIVHSWGDATEYSDTSGSHFIAPGVQSISVGQGGIASFVTTSGDAYWYGEAYGGTSFLISGVRQVTTGVDASGHYEIEAVFNDNTASEYRWGYQNHHFGHAWHAKDYNVQSISKSRNGIVDTVSWASNAWEFDTSGNYTLLTTNAVAAG